jgi:hypothetical protein
MQLSITFDINQTCTSQINTNSLSSSTNINKIVSVDVLCEKHGIFKCDIKNDLNGLDFECPKCNKEHSTECNTECTKKRKKYTYHRDKRVHCTQDFIKKAIILHGDIYDYSNVVYENSKTKVVIICKMHGPFEQSPNKHLSGHGCKKCNKSYVGYRTEETKVKEKKVKPEEIKKFIDNAIKIHGDKYDYSNVVYTGNRTNIAIVCKDHGIFEQTPYKHLNGSGCNNCEFIKKAKLIHGDKYDYSKVDYKYSSVKIVIMCKDHGPFEQIPNNHLAGNGCKKCYRSNTKKFIEKATILHGNKYDYSKVEYENNRSKVTIVCKNHGPFEQTPNTHLSGSGCIKCAYTSSFEIKRQKMDVVTEFML